MCRRGNDSQYVVDDLIKYLAEPERAHTKIECIKDLIGGLQEWSNVVDKTFPKY